MDFDSEYTWLENAKYPDSIHLATVTGLNEDADLIEATAIAFEQDNVYLVPVEAMLSILVDFLDYLYSRCTTEDQVNDLLSDLNYYQHSIVHSRVDEIRGEHDGNSSL